ncbi:hypothetical protein C2G38_2199965 [Gigaspora rosea]|uniref:SAM domain-containing protein n=1 Tax=Gigaspora rosea TaxID=44941 RepID=A0A397UTJ9_9GLOM|nr:hypothetical protein C2G38_2199965 [Gigaspora rosea]
MSLYKYQIGTCYRSLKCLYCDKDLYLEDKCKCNLDQKPTKKNTKKTVFIRYYKPTLASEQINFLKEKSILFNFNIDFSSFTLFSLCSTCHSIFQRLKLSINKPISLSQTLQTSFSDTSIESSIDNNSILNDFDTLSEDDEEQNIFDLSFSLSIKPFGSSALPSKYLRIQVFSFDELLVELHANICALLKCNDIEDYLIAYKLEKAIGAGSQLSDINDFEKFINDYNNAKKNKKNIVVIVTMKKKITKKNKRKIINEDDSSSQDEALNKKKTSRVPKVTVLTEAQQIEATHVKSLREYWHCKQHGLACYVNEDIHMKLTHMHLALWAKDIINGQGDIYTLPTHPCFAFEKVRNSKNLTELSQLSQNNNCSSNFTSQWTNPLPMPPIMPFFYPFSFGSYSQPSNQNTIQNNSSDFLQLPEAFNNIKKTPLPTLLQFFESLDKKNNETGIFTSFIDNFEKECIQVDQIYDLTDEEFKTLGVDKIGWRKIIRKAAEEYK